MSDRKILVVEVISEPDIDTFNRFIKAAIARGFQPMAPASLIKAPERTTSYLITMVYYE